MSHDLEFLEFVWLPTFERTATRSLDEEDLRGLEQALMEDPVRGALMRRTGGFRKVRWGAKGQGKRGGTRVIYFYVARRRTIYMVLAYGKDMKDDLTEGDRAELRGLARMIKEEED